MSEAKSVQESKKKEKVAPKSKLGNWMQRNPKRFLVLVNLFGLCLILLIFEILLRSWGLVPGYLDMGWDDFRPLPKGEKLQISKEFYTDAEGIFKALPDSFNHRPHFHVNSWGFRGDEFEPNDSSRKKIMLIGDSFTWGANARPITNSYADLIRKPEYQVMNFGIPGTEPDQYAHIAAHYIPLVKPDMVCVFFYMGNDVLMMRQDVKPFQSRYHLTQIGWLNAFLDGDYIGDAEATYAYYLKRFNLPQTTFFNKICAQTVIGTRLWQFLTRVGILSDDRDPEIQARIDSFQKNAVDGPFSGEYLRKIQAQCKAAEIPLKLFVMSDHNDISRPANAETSGLFQGFDYFFPEDMTIDDYYGRPDGHYNNSGHQKMAKHVLNEIEKVFPPRKD